MKKILIKDQSGAAAIEFAIVAPIFFLLLMGILELGIFFYAQNVIENATAASSRYGITGQNYKTRAEICPGMANRAAFIRCAVDKYSKGLLDESKVRIQTQVLNNFDGVDPSNYNLSNINRKVPNYGGANKAVIYRVSYTWNFFTPLIGHFFSANNTYNIQSTILVKNENFKTP